MTASALRDEIFAGNRASGQIALSVRAAAGMSRRMRVHEAGSLRVRFPRGDGSGALDAVLVNTAGGMAGGDRFDLDMTVAAGARLNVTTTAAERIYRSLGADTQVNVTLQVGQGSALAWLPQETILFDQARFRRSIDVALARDAALIVAEATVFGRSASGEVVDQGYFCDRWRIRAAGTLVFAESIRLDGPIRQRLAHPAVAAGGVAIASVIKIPGGDADVAAVRAIQESAAGEIGVSGWNGLIAVRLVARDGAALRRDLIRVLRACDVATPPRPWLN